MTELKFSQIDAFAARPFEGNSAAVIRLDDWLDDAVLQSIALEMNLSETAFLTPCADSDADYHLRWFTPSVEVAMCGHATLASGFHILSLHDEMNMVRFKTRQAGILSVTRDGDALTLDLPIWLSEDHEDATVLSALGGNPVALRIRSGHRDAYIAVYESEAEIRALRPDIAALGALGNILFVATAPADTGRNYDVVSRVFAPGGGIDEDPVTGSAHAFLAPYWADRLGRNSFKAYQASARGGYLDCTVDGARAALRGTCVKVIDGVLYI